MKNSNTLSKSEFIKYSVLFSVIAVMAYRGVCFTGIGGTTALVSEIVFWALVVFLIPLGAYITYRDRKNYLSILINTVLPLEIYGAVSTYRSMPAVITVILSVAAVVSAAYFCLIVFRKVRNRNHAREIISVRVKFASLGMRTIIALLLLTIAVPVCMQTASGVGKGDDGTGITAEDEPDNKWSFNNNVSTIEKIRPEKWRELDKTEKLRVLETIKNVEMYQFGISQPIYLGSEDLEGTVRGCYQPDDNSILIDSEVLDTEDAEDVLRTLLHECRHVYDKACSDAYKTLDDEYKELEIFETIAEYSDSFENYVEAKNDESGYYFQAVEISARQYSEAMVRLYYARLDLYDEKLTED